MRDHFDCHFRQLTFLMHDHGDCHFKWHIFEMHDRNGCCFWWQTPLKAQSWWVSQHVNYATATLGEADERMTMMPQDMLFLLPPYMLTSASGGKKKFFFFFFLSYSGCTWIKIQTWCTLLQCVIHLLVLALTGWKKFFLFFSVLIRLRLLWFCLLWWSASCSLCLHYFVF